MYKITIINGSTPEVIHATAADEQKVVNGKLTEAIGSIPTLTFRVYPTNTLYNSLYPITTKIELYDSKKDDDIFKGRILQIADSMDSNGLICKDVTCEGELGYLCDSMIEDKISYASGAMSHQIYAAIIDAHNDSVGSDKQFSLGDYVITGLPVKTEVQWVSGYDALVTFANACGQEFRLNTDRELEFADQLGEISNQVIRLATNMTAITQTVSADSMITRFYPLGGYMDSGNRLTVKPSGQTSGTNYIDNDDLIAEYGILCGSYIFDDIVSDGGSDWQSDAEELYNTGLEYFENLSQVTTSYQVSALDLSEVNEDYGSLELYNTYRVINDIMGIDTELRVTGRTLDLDYPFKSTLTFGDTAATLTSQTATKAAGDYVSAASFALANTTINNTIDNLLDGLTVKNLTADAYASILHLENTIYIVTDDDGNVTIYKGDTQISGKGGGGGSSGLLVDMWELSVNDSRLSTNGWSVECSAEICTRSLDTWVWTITELYSDGSSTVMQASEFVFYNGDTELSNSGLVVDYSATVNGADITTYSTEPLSQLFDGDTSTKVGITNYAAPLVITFYTEKGTTDITGYGFYTGKDSASYPQRDPISWTLSKNGEIVDTQTQVAYTHGNCVLAFKGGI